MSTVQLAIRNQRYAAALAELLQKDGEHHVVFVDRPDLSVDGIMVVDGNRAENLALFEREPGRFVVIARKDAELLAKVWEAGVRHVVFEEDSAATALLSVIAAELRIPHQFSAVPAGARTESNLTRKFPIPILNNDRYMGLRRCFGSACKPLL